MLPVYVVSVSVSTTSVILPPAETPIAAVALPIYAPTAVGLPVAVVPMWSMPANPPLLTVNSWAVPTFPS